MTLFQIIQILKEIALAQPNIKSATDGSIYDVMNTNPSVKYDVVHFSQTTHQSDETTDYYGLNIFYVSRLEDSLEDNRLQIQSIGKEVLDNIIRTFCENWGIDIPIITYTPFTQKFNDLCAGCYCNLRLEIPKEIICADDYVAEVVPGSGIKLQDIGITIAQNGLIVVTPDAEYDGIGEVRIEVDVPQSAAVLQDKEVEYTENGSYSIHPDPAYDGLSSVSVDVLVPDKYDEGYDDGKQDGEAEQKAKLVSTAVTQNGTYSREDGYSSIEVNVPQTGQTINNQTKFEEIDNADTQLLYDSKRNNYKYVFKNDQWGSQTRTYTYDSGYTGLQQLNVNLEIDAYEAIEQGENQQKAKMSALTVTANGEYNREDGWSAVTVNVPSDYQDGYDDGAADQKAKLVPTAITQNGTYSREDGYSAITVNVDDRYDEGYDDGYKAGAAACSGLLATAITLNVASAITDSGTATTTYSPSTAYTDIYYTSSDTSKATIDENTGEITVIANGTVTICTRDRMSGLQDCKTVNVVKTQPITAFTYTADTSTIPYSGASRTITYSTSGFNSSSIGFICPDGADYRKNGTTITVIFPYNYYGNQKSYTARLTGYTSDGTYIDTPINYTQEAYPTKGTFTVIYNVTSTSIPTRIMNYNCGTCGAQTSAIFSSATLNNGTVIPLTGDTTNGIRYTFPTTGRVAVNYTLKGGVLGDTSFYNCPNLVEVRSMNGVKIIEHRTFEKCSNLTSITIPNTVVRIGGLDQGDVYRGGRTFAECTSLRNITLPTSITSLCTGTFDGCTALSAITIPANVQEINSWCFDNCSGLTSMTFNGDTLQTIPFLDGQALGPASYTFPFYVPANAVSLYKSNSSWTGYANRVQAIP